MSLLFNEGIGMQKEKKTLDWLLEEATLSQVTEELTIYSGQYKLLRETETRKLYIGDAVIVGGLTGHEKGWKTAWGTREPKETIWKCFQETLDEVFEDNPTRPKTWIYSTTAKRSKKKLGLKKSLAIRLSTGIRNLPEGKGIKKGPTSDCAGSYSALFHLASFKPS